MADTKHKFTSFSAPTPADLAAWKALSLQERQYAFDSFVDRTLTKPTLRMTRGELMADARASLLNG